MLGASSKSEVRTLALSSAAMGHGRITRREQADGVSVLCNGSGKAGKCWDPGEE